MVQGEMMNKEEEDSPTQRRMMMSKEEKKAKENSSRTVEEISGLAFLTRRKLGKNETMNE